MLLKKQIDLKKNFENKCRDDLNLIEPEVVGNLS